MTDKEHISSSAKNLFRNIFVLVSVICSVISVEPSFDVPVINVTSATGHTAVLPCSVDHLGEHKVVWTDPWNTLLSLDDRRIIDDDRISVERPYTKDWNLHIREVRYKDRGQYTCQLNTNPIKTKIIILHVLVPPKINSGMSSGDMVVREGDSVTLVCNATGVPMPEINWWKSTFPQSTHNQVINKERLDLVPGRKSSIGHCTYKLKRQGLGSGAFLLIQNMSRYCEGLYECIAYNNVAPAVNRQISVEVEFPPEVRLPTKRLGQLQGRETILECVVTAFPQAITVWKRHGRVIQNTGKYRIELYNEARHTVTLSLRIREIEKKDYGAYVCHSENSLGKDKETMILHDITVISTTSTTTTTPRLINHLDSGVYVNGRHENGKNPDTMIETQPSLPQFPDRAGHPNQAGERVTALGSNMNSADKLADHLHPTVFSCLLICLSVISL